MQRPTKEQLEQYRRQVQNGEWVAVSDEVAKDLLAEIDVLTAERDVARENNTHLLLRMRVAKEITDGRNPADVAFTYESHLELARRQLVEAKQGERQARREGFEVGQAWDFDHDQPKFPTWEQYEKHLAELEEDAAREIRLAEYEEKEKEGR